MKKLQISAKQTQEELVAYKNPRKDYTYDGRIASTLQLFGYHFAKQSIEVPYFPPVIWIEPTSRCNLRCPMCLTGKGEVKEVSSGMMDMSLFNAIVTQLIDKPIIRTALFFRGEPLLHPKIVEMVSLAAQYNLRPYFHTNGTLMTQELAEGLIKAGLTYISFSFDGENKEEYEATRVGGRHETTFKNIVGFLEIKKQLESELPYVVIQKVDFDGKGITENYKKMFNNLPVNQFKANPTHNWSGEIEEISIKEKETLTVYPCPDPWQRLTICWDGIVVACCNDMLQKYILGDVKKETLEHIWNGEKIKELRYLMKTCRNKDIKLCKGCSFLYVNDWTI